MANLKLPFNQIHAQGNNFNVEKGQSKQKVDKGLRLKRICHGHFNKKIEKVELLVDVVAVIDGGQPKLAITP